MGAKVTMEIKKATAHLKPSAFDESAEGNIVSVQTKKPEPQKTRLDNERFKGLEDQLKTRASKDDSEMALRQIEIIHK